MQRTGPHLAATECRAPDGSRIYAIGDIHGRADLLVGLLARIAADAADAGDIRKVVVFLGDYIDRGPDSRAVIERLMAGPPATGPLAGAEWICLKGNHEHYMVRFLTEISAGPAWCAFGGLSTVESYVGHLPESGCADMAGLQLALSRALPPAHLRFLSRLKLSHVEGDYMFVHAGVRPGVALDRQDAADLLWIRDDFLFGHDVLGKVIVHGHTQCAQPEIRSHRIGIDTGAYGSGHLTALVLEGTERRFLMT